MAKTLRSYQEDSLKILKGDTSGLDASEMGAGKTLTATERVRYLDTKGRVPRVLVVGPVNTHKQWVASFSEQYPPLNGSRFLRIIGSPKSDPESWEMVLRKLPGVYITSWEAMRGSCPRSIMAMPEGDPAGKDRITGPLPEGWVKVDGRGASRGYGDLYGKGNTVTVKALKEAMKCGDVPPWHKTGMWDLIIADESHRLQNRNSSNLLVLRMIKTSHKLALSGTPAGNKPEGLWSTLNWLWKDKYPAFWPWAHQHLVIDEEYIGPNRPPIKVIVGEKHPGAIFRGIPSCVRWQTSQVIDQMPSVVEKVISVPMGPKQKKIYQDFEKDSFVWLGEQPVLVDLPAVKRIRLRQAALGQIKGELREVLEERHIRVWGAHISGCFASGENHSLLWSNRIVGSLKYYDRQEVLDVDFDHSGEQPKIEAIKEIMEDLPEGEPVLIFTHSAKWAVLCADALDKGYGPARAWTGALTGARREALKEDFGKGVRVLVAQVAALAEGVDGLQHVCRCEIWASPSEDGILNEQAKARLLRPGQKDVVRRWLLHSEGTIDDDVDFNLRLKKAQMKKMYGDS